MKPDLTEYLGVKTVAKSKFLKYKSLLEKSEGCRAWYESTFEEQFEKFFSDTDWNKVDSNVERLPYLAYMLEKIQLPSLTSLPPTASFSPLQKMKTGRTN